MLELVVPKSEQYDDDSGCFITTKEQTLRLEHSLVSLSKWEAKWHKPYLSTKSKTVEEQIDYVRCMTLTQNVDPNVYTAITPQLLAVVKDYIEDSMTATTFSKEQRGRRGREIVTAEIIYYWMISHQIPFECQKWHLNPADDAHQRMQRQDWPAEEDEPEGYFRTKPRPERGAKEERKHKGVTPCMKNGSGDS